MLKAKRIRLYKCDKIDSHFADYVMLNEFAFFELIGDLLMEELMFFACVSVGGAVVS